MSASRLSPISLAGAGPVGLVEQCVEVPQSRYSNHHKVAYLHAGAEALQVALAHDIGDGAECSKVFGLFRVLLWVVYTS